MLRSLKSILLMSLLLVMLSGCSNMVGSKELMGQIHVIKEQLMVEDWDALEVQMDRLSTIYSDNEWKLQMIGDEGEYERLHESINRLRSAIETQDSQSASLELSTIDSIAEDIYSF